MTVNDLIPHGRRTAPAKRKTNRAALFVLLGALVAVVLAGVAASVYLGSVLHSFDAQTKKIGAPFPDDSSRPAPAAPAADGKTPINILIVGSDSRRDTIAQAEAGSASDQRSDTMILVHIPADRQHVYVVSIMRDLWVPIPGHGSAKINAALADGGVPLMVQTVESFLGQRLDHVMIMDFDGFKALTDAVGGVDVNVTVPFASTMAENPGLPFTQGTMHMDGRTAFAFIHERYAFPDGDYQRVRDQQVLLRALVAKIAKPETLANPVELASAVSTFSPYLAVDPGFSSGVLVSLGLELAKVRPSDIVTFTLPTNGTGWSADGQSIVLANPAATSGLADAMARGTMPQYVDQYRLANGN